MKTPVFVFTGFLESGKTTCIQNLLKKGCIGGQNQTVLVCCEQGMEEYDPELLKNTDTVLLKVESIEEFTYNFFDDILYNYHPGRILVEYNGTWPAVDLLKVKLPADCMIETVLCMVDGSTFSLYAANTGGIMTEQLVNADAVIINRYQHLTAGKYDTVRRYIHLLNPRAVFDTDKNLFGCRSLRQSLLEPEKNPTRSFLKACAYLVPLLTLFVYLSVLKIADFDGRQAMIQSFNTVFVSLLIQTIPFILIGTFLSSILQICVSEDKLVRLFHKPKWFGYALAVVMGVFFPVCDCAMAPVAARLVRKGVPFPYAITFLLATPAVSPIVIMSTLYAFPNQPIVALWRVIIGIAVALSAGIVLSLTKTGKKAPVRDTLLEATCASGYMGNINTKTTVGKIEAIFRHASLEFFNIGKFVVVGAFLSSVIQSSVSKTALASIGSTPVLSLIVMLLAAFVMSLCSNSNAFIARSFSASIPLPSLLCFMIMGPLLDIKNLLMLSSSFKKSFLFKMVLTLLLIALVGFSFVGFWL